VKRYWDGILQRFDSKIGNGLIVGINSPVQAAKAKARGYRLTRNLKAIIYLLTGSATRLRARPLASAMAGTTMGAADVTVECVNGAVSKGATTGAKAAGCGWLRQSVLWVDRFSKSSDHHQCCSDDKHHTNQQNQPVSWSHTTIALRAGPNGIHNIRLVGSDLGERGIILIGER
jgi:hypothetical protein